MFHVIVKDVIDRKVKELIMEGSTVDKIYHMIEADENYRVLAVHPIQTITSVEEISNIDGIGFFRRRKR